MISFWQMHSLADRRAGPRRLGGVLPHSLERFLNSSLALRRDQPPPQSLGSHAWSKLCPRCLDFFGDSKSPTRKSFLAQYCQSQATLPCAYAHAQRSTSMFFWKESVRSTHEASLSHDESDHLALPISRKLSLHGLTLCLLLSAALISVRPGLQTYHTAYAPTSLRTGVCRH